MNLKNYLIFILLTLGSLGAMAQKYEVRGRIAESETSEVLPYVNIQLLSTDSAIVANVNTNDKGEFLLKAKKAGKYIVKAKPMGFKPLLRNVELSKQKPALNLGTIKMNPITTELDELNVSALARMMTMKEDTLLFNTAAFRLPPNASLAAMMKEIPGISVDKDGNLTYQGKVVSNILVDGKPFFGDVSTALANMPTDAVQNVKIYEKTDENKEFRRQLDTDKATVVDLTIKQEYKSKWIANVNAGGGTNKHYIGKVFATNFTDHRRTAVYAQVNNISQNQQVDANGNWYYYNTGAYGIYDYRKAGAIMQLDNGKSNTESGNMRGNANVDVYHNDLSYNTVSTSEQFLGTGKSQYTYGRSNDDTRNVGVDVNGMLTYNIDQNNRFNFRVGYSYTGSNMKGIRKSSTYHTKPEEMDNMEESLVGDNISDEQKALGVNSLNGDNDSKSHGNKANLNAYYTHLFNKAGRSLDISLSGNLSDNLSKSNLWQYYRYFNANAPQPELLNRQHTNTNSLNYSLSASASYAEPISEHVKFDASYSFSHNNEDMDNELFDIYTRPLAMRPTPGDSLVYVNNIANSFYSDSHTNRHRLSPSLQGTWDKVEGSLSGSFTLYSDYLRYQRDSELYTPSRTYLGSSVSSSLKYKLSTPNYIQATYIGNTDRPSLTELLPIRDTSNPMQETVNNPNLKSGWSNYVSLSSLFFNTKRGDSYNIYATFGNRSNSVVTTEETDPVTGFRRIGKANVNGNFNTSISFSTDQPLDSMRHWNLTASTYFSYSHNTGYVGSMGNALGLSEIDNFSPTVRMGLRYRKGIWSMSLSSFYRGDFTRYKETPQYNQNGHTYEVIFTPQVDLPFGMKINSSFIYYGRSGFADPLLNHPQWIINASISQSFLKSKALTLQLEGTDLLKSRTAETSLLTHTSRYYSRTDTFLSYVMLHATYRFSL